MRVNRNIIWLCLISTIISAILLCFLYKCPLAEAFLTAILTGSILGVIVPAATFCNIKHQTTIEFTTICRMLLNRIREINCWYCNNFHNLNYDELYPIEGSIEEQQVKLECKDRYDASVKYGFQLVVNYADSFPDKLYSIIDDYCGLFKQNNKIKKQMFILRDLLGSFNYQHIKELSDNFSLLQNCFEGGQCKKLLEEYRTHTDLCNKVASVMYHINQFQNITRVTKYTKKVQRQK